jgi:hypothetical protein
VLRDVQHDGAGLEQLQLIALKRGHLTEELQLAVLETRLITQTRNDGVK